MLATAKPRRGDVPHLKLYNIQGMSYVLQLYLRAGDKDELEVIFAKSEKEKGEVVIAEYLRNVEGGVRWFGEIGRAHV